MISLPKYFDENDTKRIKMKIPCARKLEARE